MRHQQTTIFISRCGRVTHNVCIFCSKHHVRTTAVSGSGGLSQPGSARTTGDSVAGSGVQFGTPSGTPRSGGGRVPATGIFLQLMVLVTASLDDSHMSCDTRVQP